jgi:hypothetical protein
MDNFPLIWQLDYTGQDGFYGSNAVIQGNRLCLFAGNNNIESAGTREMLIHHPNDLIEDNFRLDLTDARLGTT